MNKALCPLFLNLEYYSTTPFNYSTLSCAHQLGVLVIFECWTLSWMTNIDGYLINILMNATFWLCLLQSSMAISNISHHCYIFWLYIILFCLWVEYLRVNLSLILRYLIQLSYLISERISYFTKYLFSEGLTTLHNN